MSARADSSCVATISSGVRHWLRFRAWYRFHTTAAYSASLAEEYFRDLGVTEVGLRLPTAGRDEVLGALDDLMPLLDD